MKTALVKQGLYCLNTSGMDLDTTAEEIKNSVDNDELQKQLEDLVKRYCVANDYYFYHLSHTLPHTTRFHHTLPFTTGVTPSHKTSPGQIPTGDPLSTSLKQRRCNSHTVTTKLRNSFTRAAWPNIMNMI